ncbi:MAG: hypothetical protein ACM34K_12500 [Bacillota bacterium]
MNATKRKKRIANLVKSINKKAEKILKEESLKLGTNPYELSPEEINKRYEHRFYADKITGEPTILNSDILLDGIIILQIRTDLDSESGLWGTKYIYGEEIKHATA